MVLVGIKNKDVLWVNVEMDQIVAIHMCTRCWDFLV